MRITAIVPSAGKSRRMKSAVEKPYLLLGDKPVLAHTLMALERSSFVQEVILLVRRSRIPLAKKLVRRFGLRKVTGIYAGGVNRFESVWQGLQKVSPASDFVLVHDGARPLVSEALIQKVVRAAYRYGAAIPVLPVSTTVKQGKGRFVTKTVDRRELWEVQTPQVFRRALLMAGYLKGKREGITTTDCAALVERLGKKVCMVPGDPRNLKMTTKEELAFSAVLLNGERKAPCAWE